MHLHRWMNRPLFHARVTCLLMLLLGLLPLVLSAQAEERSGYKRILSLGPDVTEIIYAVGAGADVIGVDRGSKYPDDTLGKPNVGYRRALSAEGVIALNPDLILAAGDIGPPEAVDILKGLSIPIVFVPEDNSEKGIVRKIEVIAKTLGREGEGKLLADRVIDDFRQATALTANMPDAERKKVVFFHGLVRLTGAGSGTAADAIIKYAGGLNPLDSYKGYKAVSEENLLEAGPQVVLMMPDAAGGPTAETVFSIPALATTPAGRDHALVLLDGAYMLGFGPRTATAIRDLAKALYPQLEAAAKQ